MEEYLKDWECATIGAQETDGFGLEFFIPLLLPESFECFRGLEALTWLLSRPL